MTDTTLDDLMEKVAKGDKVAFRALARGLSPRLFAAAYRLMGGDKMAAEDALQETFIKLWTSAPRYVAQGTPYAYAVSILHHVCMDLHRKKQKGWVPLDDEMPAHQNSAFDNVRQKNESAMLARYINALPDRQRQAVLLSYYNDESNKAIADMLQTSEKAVESLLVRARQTLARTLPQDMRASQKEKGETK